MGVVTHDKNQAQFKCQYCVFFAAAIQNSRAITYLASPYVSGAKFLATSMREFEWSEFQPVPALVAKLGTVWVRISERAYTIATLI